MALPPLRAPPRPGPAGRRYVAGMVIPASLRVPHSRRAPEEEREADRPRGRRLRPPPSLPPVAHRSEAAYEAARPLLFSHAPADPPPLPPPLPSLSSACRASAPHMFAPSAPPMAAEEYAPCMLEPSAPPLEAILAVRRSDLASPTAAAASPSRAVGAGAAPPPPLPALGRRASNGRSVRRVVQSVLSRRLDSVLELCPKFRHYYDELPDMPKARLRRAWRPQRAQQLRPLLSRCADLGCFADLPAVEVVSPAAADPPAAPEQVPVRRRRRRRQQQPAQRRSLSLQRTSNELTQWEGTGAEEACAARRDSE